MALSELLADSELAFSERVDISAAELDRLEVEAGPGGDTGIDAEDDDAAHHVPAAVRPCPSVLPF